MTWRAAKHPRFCQCGPSRPTVQTAIRHVKLFAKSQSQRRSPLELLLGGFFDSSPLEHLLRSHEEPTTRTKMGNKRLCLACLLFIILYFCKPMAGQGASDRPATRITPSTIRVEPLELCIPPFLRRGAWYAAALLQASLTKTIFTKPLFTGSVRTWKVHDCEIHRISRVWAAQPQNGPNEQRRKYYRKEASNQHAPMTVDSAAVMALILP